MLTGSFNAPRPQPATAETSPSRLAAPLRYCAVPGCSAKVSSGRCEAHRTQQRQVETRYTKGKYGRPWRRAVAQWIAEEPDTRAFCAECQRDGKLVLGEETDHIVPHRGNDSLFWDRSNWQRLCRVHHSSKTAVEVGWRGHEK